MCEPSPFSYFCIEIILAFSIVVILFLKSLLVGIANHFDFVEHWTLYFTYWYTKILVSDHNIIPKYLYLTFLIHHLVVDKESHARHNPTIKIYFTVIINICGICLWSKIYLYNSTKVYVSIKVNNTSFYRKLHVMPRLCGVLKDSMIKVFLGYRNIDEILKVLKKKIIILLHFV